MWKINVLCNLYYSVAYYKYNTKENNTAMRDGSVVVIKNLKMQVTF